MKQRQPLKRGKRPRPVSAKRAAERDERAVIREAVFKRDGWKCRMAGVGHECRGPLTFQHIVKASQGGAYSEENGATLCAHHNDRLEADASLAALARTMGLVRLSWERT